MSAQPEVDVSEDLVEDTLIAYFRSDPISAACNPDYWDSDRKYTVPNLSIKCTIGEQLIPAAPVYAYHCIVTLGAKPKRYTFAIAWKKIRTLVETQTLHASLSNNFVTIGSNAEDITGGKDISSDTRKRELTFTLRGYARI